MRDQVWNGITESYRLTRYYAALSDKLRRRHRLFAVITTVAASGAAVAFLAQAPAWAGTAVAVLAASSTIWSSYSDYSGKAAMASAASSQYQELATEWKQLWFGEIADNQITRLELKDVAIARGLPIEEDVKLNQRAQEEAYAVVVQDFRSPENRERAPSPSPHAG